MLNIIKSINYQIRRDNATYVIILIIAGITALFVADSIISASPEEINGGMMAVLCSEAFFMSVSAAAVLFTARICGWDFNDKTINYELLSGHRKADIFFGRFIVAFVFVTALCLITVGLPVLVCTLFKGWGYNADLKGMLIRFGMMIIPIFRIVCEMTLITFLVRNCYGAMILGWLGYEFGLVVSMIPEEFFDSKLDISLFFSASSVYNILTISNYSFGYVDGKDIEIFETALSELHLYGTVATGLGVGALCLAVSYLIFTKRDMN